MPSSFVGDSGLGGGGGGYALATPLVSPIPSSRLLELLSSKGLSGGRSVF
jgi:hypothetical protein